MKIRFVLQPGGIPVYAEMTTCPRFEEFVDLGDGINRWVSAVRWHPFWAEPDEVGEFAEPAEAQVELRKGHPPRWRRALEEAGE